MLFLFVGAACLLPLMSFRAKRRISMSDFLQNFIILKTNNSENVIIFSELIPKISRLFWNWWKDFLFCSVLVGINNMFRYSIIQMFLRCMLFSVHLFRCRFYKGVICSFLCHSCMLPFLYHPLFSLYCHPERSEG